MTNLALKEIANNISEQVGDIQNHLKVVRTCHRCSHLMAQVVDLAMGSLQDPLDCPRCEKDVEKALDALMTLRRYLSE